MLHCNMWSSYIRSFFTIWSVKPSTHLSRSIITLSLYLPKYPSTRLDSPAPVSPPPPQWAERAVREVARVLRSCARLCCAHPGMRCALERASDSREVSRAPRSGTATSQNTQSVSFLKYIARLVRTDKSFVSFSTCNPNLVLIGWHNHRRKLTFIIYLLLADTLSISPLIGSAS